MYKNKVGFGLCRGQPSYYFFNSQDIYCSSHVVGQEMQLVFCSYRLYSPGQKIAESPDPLYRSKGVLYNHLSLQV